MLVLSRRKSESIVVDDSIVVTVLEIRGDTVRIGIDAPDGTPAHRSEILQRIQRAHPAAEVDPSVALE